MPEPGATVNVYWVKSRHGSLSPQQKRFGFVGPARRVVHAGPNQSMRRDGRGAANGLLDRTGRTQLTARANIVTWPDRRVHGFAVHTRRHGGINPLG